MDIEAGVAASRPYNKQEFGPGPGRASRLAVARLSESEIWDWGKVPQAEWGVAPKHH